jgi:hypothetical protein
MAVHLFYEETKLGEVSESNGEATLEINRYYYDDISDEILIRSFQSHGAQSRPPTFRAEDRMSVADAPEHIRQRASHLKSESAK